MYFENNSETDNNSSISDTDSDITSLDSDIIIPYSGDEISEYSDSDIMLINDDEYDYIYDEDEEHVLSEKIHNKYYIGKCFKLKSDFHKIENDDNIYHAISISSRIYFKHSYNDIINYLNMFSSYNCFNYYKNVFYRHSSGNIDIMKSIVIQKDNLPYYTVILKTHWIRLIQRHWKRVYKLQKYIIKQRSKIENIRFREVHGLFPKNISYIPNLKGLLKCYIKK
tara:strand:- start:105 stop:776 length:672 start_codon:yes stop_codon:yes gene_type:complete